jgi:hypothetical protein
MIQQGNFLLFFSPRSSCEVAGSKIYSAAAAAAAAALASLLLLLL